MAIMSKFSKIFMMLSIVSLLTTLLAPLMTLLIAPPTLLAGIVMFLKSKRKSRQKKDIDLKPLNIVIILPKHATKLKEIFELERETKSLNELTHHNHPLLKRVMMPCIALSLAVSSMVMLMLTSDMLSLIALAPSIILPLTPLLRRKVSESIRRQNIESELPFFSLLASALSHAGLSLVRAFNVVAKTHIFPTISSEALLLKKEALFVGGDPITAMTVYAQRHPSKVFSSWIIGYTSILRSGGDVIKYLEEKTKDLFAMLKEKWNSFVNHVNIMGEAILALFLLAPLMLSMTTLVFAYEVNESIYELLIFGVIPLLAFTITWSLHVARPQESFEYKPSSKNIIMAVALFTLSLSAMFLIKTSISNLVLISLLFLASPLTLSYEIERTKSHNIEKELTRFLRYLGENKKLGIPILTALERASKEQYNKTFSLFIKGVLGKMKLGLSLYQSVLTMKIKSRICKIVFFILDNLIASGGGSPATFEVMASFVDEYHKHRARVRRSLYLYSILGYATPLILAICLSLTTSFMITGSVEITGVSAIEGLASSNLILPQFHLDYVMLYSKLMIIASSIAMGVILGKAVDGSIFSMKHLLICSVVALISLNLLL
ncbi:MAG: type II secretion system F family protein [Candidatus Nezhaarchaeales archaeon]